MHLPASGPARLGEMNISGDITVVVGLGASKGDERGVGGRVESGEALSTFA